MRSGEETRTSRFFESINNGSEATCIHANLLSQKSGALFAVAEGMRAQVRSLLNRAQVDLLATNVRLIPPKLLISSARTS